MCCQPLQKRSITVAGQFIITTTALPASLLVCLKDQDVALLSERPNPKCVSHLPHPLTIQVLQLNAGTFQAKIKHAVKCFKVPSIIIRNIQYLFIFLSLCMLT